MAGVPVVIAGDEALVGKFSGNQRIAQGHQRGLNRIAAAFVAWLLAQPFVASAADPAPQAPSGAIPRIEQLRASNPAPKDNSAALPDQPATPKELGKPADDILVDVASYAVNDSASSALKTALPGLTAPFVGKQRSYEDLVNAASTVTRFMQRELGYYLAYAYLPAQAPADGVIKIEVLDGRLDEVIVKWPENLPVKHEVIEGYLSKLKSGDILRVRDVERVVFLINDLYGIRVRFEVKSGRTPGTASLVVTPQAETRLTGRVDLDMNGSRYSGVGRISGVAAWASPLNRGDSLTASGLVTITGGLKFALVNYSTPVGSDGLKLGASVSSVQYQLDKHIIASNFHGEATALGAYALYPVIRSRNLNTFTSATLESKDYSDVQQLVPRNSRTQDLQLGLVGDFRDNWLTGGVNTYELSWMHGHLSLQNGLLTVPANFNKYGLGYSRLQNLISGRLMAYVRYKGQVAGNNLDNTERMSLGGPSGIRAYAPGEGTADSAHVLTTELRWLPPESLFGRSAREMVFSAFYDLGMAKVQQHPASSADSTLDNSPTLGGAGLGFVWERPSLFAVRMSLAWPTQGVSVNDKQPRSPRMYATFSKNL